MLEFILGSFASLQLGLYFESLGMPSYWAFRMPALLVAGLGLLLLLVVVFSKNFWWSLAIPQVAIAVLLLGLAPQVFGFGFFNSMLLAAGFALMLLIVRYATRRSSKNKRLPY